MAKFVGRLVQIGVGRETSRGAGATPLYQLPRTTLTFDDKVVKARSLGSLGLISDSEEAFVTTKYGQGDIEGEIRSSSFGLMLYAMLGSYSVAGPTDSSYTHSFTVSQSNQHQSLAFTVTDANTTELYKLVMLDSLEITTALDQVTKFLATFMSKCGRDTGLVVPAPVAEYKFTKKHLSIKIAANIASLAAATPISVKELSIKFSKNVALDDVLGTAEPEDILNHQLAIEGKMTLNYEAETYKNYMKNGDSKAMQLQWLNTDSTIGASTNPALTMQFPKVDFFAWEPTYGLEDIAGQKMSFKASRDVANAVDIISTCQLVNTITTYT
jgi:hypothetical protein